MKSTLSKDISELLYHYDCVIVPALGGFVTNYRPARLDKDLHLFHPPTKEVSFNRQLEKNDGILAHAIAQAKEVSHEEANAMIRSEVESYFSAMDNGGRVVFDKVGILYLDKEQNVQFSPDESVNYLLDSFGLKKVHAVPVQPKVVVEPVHAPVIISAPPVSPRIETKEPLVAPVVVAPVTKAESTQADTPVIALKQEEKSGKKWYWAAAVIPLLFLLAVAGYKTDMLGNGSTSVAELDPFKDSVASTYERREGSLDIATEAMPGLLTDTAGEWFANKAPVEVATPAIEVPTTREPDPSKTRLTEVAEPVNTYTATAEVVQMEFHIIAGCFSLEENALKMVDKLRAKGFTSYVLDQRKGLYRVTYGSYATRSSALIDLKAVKEDNDSSAWLLRKR